MCSAFGSLFFINHGFCVRRSCVNQEDMMLICMARHRHLASRYGVSRFSFIAITCFTGLHRSSWSGRNYTTGRPSNTEDIPPCWRHSLTQQTDAMSMEPDNGVPQQTQGWETAAKALSRNDMMPCTIQDLVAAVGRASPLGAIDESWTPMGRLIRAFTIETKCQGV